MKKTLVAILACGSAAFAVTNTQIFDLTTSVTASDSPYFYNATTGTFTDNPDITGTVLNETNGNGQIQTNISFVLNLTEAQQVTSPTTILTMDMVGDIGLVLTDSGISTSWNGDTSGRSSIDYTTLTLADSGAFVAIDGNTYITLTMVQTYGSGVQLYSNTTKFFSDGGLKGSDNKTLNAITINSDYLASIQFAPEWLTTEAKWKEKNQAFDTAARPHITPEPATATLSLLALAGLAARRRRH